jgi:hypothetical protein
LQRRDEREARRVGSTPRARRERPAPRAAKAKTGLLQSVNPTYIAAVIGAIVVIGVILYAVLQSNTASGDPAWLKAELDDSASIPGQYIPPHPGFDGVFDSSTNPQSDDRKHFAPGTVVPICTQDQIDAGNVSNPLCYTSNPPTSGPHSSTPMPFRILDNPAPKENLVHNMEHGGVVIWYNTSDQNAIDLLKSVAQSNIDRNRFVVMTQYTEMEPDTVAITSWTRLDKFPVSDLTKDRVQNFINKNLMRFNPEGF